MVLICQNTVTVLKEYLKIKTSCFRNEAIVPK